MIDARMTPKEKQTLRAELACWLVSQFLHGEHRFDALGILQFESWADPFESFGEGEGSEEHVQ